MKLLLTGSTGVVGRSVLISAIRSGRYDQIFCRLGAGKTAGSEISAAVMELSLV